MYFVIKCPSFASNLLIEREMPGQEHMYTKLNSALLESFYLNHNKTILIPDHTLIKHIKLENCAFNDHLHIKPSTESV